jgi:hypothetical protein
MALITSINVTLTYHGQTGSHVQGSIELASRIVADIEARGG